MEYDAIARKIIEAQQDLIGDVALRQASSLPWIELEDDSITITGNPGKEDIDELVSTFEDITGKAAVGRARRVLADLDFEEIDLPERLQSD